MSNQFTIHDMYEFNGSYRVWAETGNTEVYIDINQKGEIVGGTFKPESEPGLMLASKAKSFLRSHGWLAGSYQ